MVNITNQLEFLSLYDQLIKELHSKLKQIHGMNVFFDITLIDRDNDANYIVFAIEVPQQVALAWDENVNNTLTQTFYKFEYLNGIRELYTFDEEENRLIILDNGVWNGDIILHADNTENRNLALR